MEAAVLEILAPGRVRVAIKGEALQARTQTPLVPGQRLLVQVEQLSPRVVLRMVAPGEASREKLLAHLRSHLVQQEPLGEPLLRLRGLLQAALRAPAQGNEPRGLSGPRPLMESLLRLLDRAVFQEPGKEAKTLPELFRLLGLTLERDLRRMVEGRGKVPEDFPPTLKSEALRLLARIPRPEPSSQGRAPALRPDSPASEASPERPAAPASGPEGFQATLRQAAETLVRNIEFQQLLNALNHETGRPLYFQIPLALPEGLATAELLVEQRDGSAQRGSRVYTLVFLLDLTRLGFLRLEAVLRDSRVDLHVWTEREPVSRWIREAFPELRQRLAERGLVLGTATCGIRPREAAERIEEGRFCPPWVFPRLLDVRA